MSIAFLITALIIVVTPGTGVLYTLTVGLSAGKRASVVAALGCTLGIVPPMLAAISGLAALLYTSALVFQVLKYLGVAYLLYRAWVTLRETGALTVAQTAPRSSARVIRSGILLNVLNPKLALFFFAFLPQFVNAHDPYAVWSMLGLSGMFMLLTLIIFVGYGVGAAAMREHVLARPRVMTWMRRLFAGTFVALGVRLALTDR